MVLVVGINKFMNDLGDHDLVIFCVRFECSVVCIPIDTLEDVICPIVFLLEVGYEYLSIKST